VSTHDPSPAELDACQACGKSIEVTPRSGLYSIIPADNTSRVTTFAFCPSCAVALVDEIAANVPIRYLDALASTVKRRVARRAEHEAVAS